MLWFLLLKDKGGVHKEKKKDENWRFPLSTEKDAQDRRFVQGKK